MIQFKTPIDTTRLRMAYNNDVLHFYSTLSNAPRHCDVNLGSIPIRLYPAPDGTFRFNLKPYITALINTRNFEDNLKPSLQVLNPSSFVYDYTAGSYLSSNVSLGININDTTNDDASYTLAWLAGVEQPGDYNRFTRSDYFVLSPLKAKSTQHYYLKYWPGYPFDISLYMPSTLTFYLKNETNLLRASLPVKGRVARVVLSDGRTDESLDDLLPLVEGHNQLRYMSGSSNKTTDKFISLEKMPYCEGVYLKWLNKYGGYSYWLFENTFSVDRSTKYTGELDRDFANVENMYARATQIGKESQDSMKIIADLLTEDDRRIVEGIMDSPKIYLFTGKPFAQNDNRSWIEVTLKTTSARIKNARQKLTNFSFDIELPQRYTQGL